MMEEVGKPQKRSERLNNIRKTLLDMPIIKKQTTHLEQKLAKNRSRRKSMEQVESILSISHVQSESDDDDTKKGRVMFKDKYNLGEKIGEGAHGVVKKCFSKETGQVFAVKVMTLDPEHILFLKRNFLDIRNLHHPKVIGYYQLFFQMKKSTCYLVMDYLPFPNLLEIQIKSQQQLKSIVYQILETLIYIHKKKICHRDIKPQNILYDQKHHQVKLIDFGISKKMIYRGSPRDMLTVTGTPYYRAPQMFQCGGYNEQVDNWALGVTIYKLMTGFTPFESQYHSETINNIMKGQYTYPSEVQAKYSRSSRNLVGRLLKKRGERLTAEEAIKDMWLIEFYQHKDDFTQSFTFHNELKGSTQLENYNISMISHKKHSQADRSQINVWKNEKQEKNLIYGITEVEQQCPTPPVAKSSMKHIGSI